MTFKGSFLLVVGALSISEMGEACYFKFGMQIGMANSSQRKIALQRGAIMVTFLDALYILYTDWS